MTVVSTLAVTSIALFAGLTVATAADKEPRFAPGPATSYAARQTNNNVTVAAIPYTTEDQVRSAFGKLDPNKYGILPLLVVIQNDGKQAIRLASLDDGSSGACVQVSRPDDQPGRHPLYTRADRAASQRKPPHAIDQTM